MIFSDGACFLQWPYRINRDWNKNVMDTNKSPCCKSFTELQMSVSSWAVVILVCCFTPKCYALSIVLFVPPPLCYTIEKPIKEFCQLLHIHFNLAFRSINSGWISVSPGPLWSEPGPPGLHEFPLSLEAITAASIFPVWCQLRPWTQQTLKYLCVSLFSVSYLYK